MSDAAADLVLCQSSFTEEGPAAHGRGPANCLHLPTGVIVAEGKLLIADAWHHRILVWDRVPDPSDTPPDWCLDQPDFATAAELPHRPQGPRRLRFPYGISLAHDTLAVADTADNRVMLWQRGGG